MSPDRDDRRGPRLDQPLDRTLSLRPTTSSDVFGRFAERFARFMGTAKFLFYMTIFVIIWITLNLVAVFGRAWDPYPFILLNLFFSTQASYAAPLILLAQNRQDDRDRVQYQEDRAQTERLIADTEYITREIASLRVALGETATRDFMRSELRDLLDTLDERSTGIEKELRRSRRRSAERT